MELKKMIESKKGMMSKNLADPSVIIYVLILLLVGVRVIIAVFPMIVDALTNLSTLSGFTFGSLFSSGGVAQIVLSVSIFAGILAILGFKIFGGKHR